MTPTCLIAGGSGFLGRSTAAFFRGRGFEVKVISRSPGSDIVWSPEAIIAGEKNPALTEAVSSAALLINFSGESIARGRLGDDHVRRLVSSRVLAVQALQKIWENAGKPGLTWIQASALGYYGDKGEALVTEKSPAGSFRLSEICLANEKAANVLGKNLEAAKGRLIVIRLSTVLSRDGEAWKKMSGATRLGAGGVMGNGRQWWHWVHLEDVLGSLWHFWENKTSRGPYNLCAVTPLRQRDFSAGIARFLKRPVQFPVPAIGLRLLFGRLADELFLSSCRAIPERLLEEGYTFACPDLSAALSELTGKKLDIFKRI